MTIPVLFETEKSREVWRVMHCSYLFFLVTIFALVVEVKDWPDPLGHRLYTVLSWPDILSISYSFGFVQIDSLRCFVWIELTEQRNLSLSFLSALFTGHVSSLPALHLQVASWSDKLRQSKGCGSLNQCALHAFSARSPFFLQRL